MTTPEKDARDEGYADGWFDGLEGRRCEQGDDASRHDGLKHRAAYRSGYELGFGSAALHRQAFPKPRPGCDRDDLDRNR